MSSVFWGELMPARRAAEIACSRGKRRRYARMVIDAIDEAAEDGRFDANVPIWPELTPVSVEWATQNLANAGYVAEVEGQVLNVWWGAADRDEKGAA